MLGPLLKVLEWLYEAAVTYAASDQGSTELTKILDELEADGIDVPFYEPSESKVDVSAQSAQASNQPSDYVPRQGKRVNPPVNSGGGA
jgi:hypothetical protein